MKLSKEDEWRISGMQYALKIAKKRRHRGAGKRDQFPVPV